MGNYYIKIRLHTVSLHKHCLGLEIFPRILRTHDFLTESYERS